MTLITKRFLKKNYFFYKFITIIYIFSILLTSCTFSQYLHNKKNSFEYNSLQTSNHNKLTDITKFQIRGTFTYINGNKKISAKFFCQQYTLFNYRLLIMNPLGLTELDLYLTPKIIKLIDKQGKKYISYNPKYLIYQLTNMKIPIEYLSYWLIGLPINATSFTLYKNGLLNTIKYKQNDNFLNINYIYNDYSNIIKLPYYIILVQDKLYINLKIDNWILKK
ncbi:Outer-membrane lipoprotein LolB precursor [Candidatus Arsenophonus lipoptenae]|uniref:Outer-membrane lipoprotein LolB n=1 Tax=Candidatus Arsenophonus lipoptenae TaxID=634113 RepID=A0A109QEM5_9GAMM|nr:lipoprotein insertase outer membrane protein LolB [Candidatus Arsenophonus lipoptenae]AMA65081.1 Outer-membrane lipoprotein LolB precursor [Candidatus Arsenophonus lipoptenae]